MKSVDVGDKMSKAGTSFCRKLAQITADELAEFPPEYREDVLVHLQDCTSLYSPFTADLNKQMNHRRIK